MAEQKKKKPGNIFMWGLLGLLAVSLVGFGAGGFGGTITSIGTVGDEEIDANTYARAVSNALAQQGQALGRPLTLQEGEQLGVLDGIRNQLISEAAIDNEAARIGLSVGDEQVREQVMAQAGGLGGTFNKELYQRSLRQQGLTVEGYENRIRAQNARTLLQGAVVGGIEAPEAYVNTLVSFLGERRSIRWIRLGIGDLENDLPAPTKDQLTEYYQANPADFTLPEMKRITFAWVAPEMLSEVSQPDDEVLRALYDERISEFQVPERRLVERLAFSDTAAATAAKARIDSGEVTFADLVADRGLELADVDLGEATRQTLGDAADAIFDMNEPGVVGPLDTSLGPALFRMNGILGEQITTFDEARSDLALELSLEIARRSIGDLSLEVEDLLAGGATLEELAKETEMQLGAIDFWDGIGESIANYNAFRDAAVAVAEGDFPEALQLEDGGLFALRLDEILEPRLQAIEAVETKVKSGWEAQQTEALLTERANQIRAQMEVGVTLEASGLSVQTAEALTRNGFVDGTPDRFMETVFDLEAEQSAVVAGFGDVFLVVLDEVMPPDPEDELVNQITEAFEGQVAQGIAAEIYNAFSRALTAEAGFNLDQTAINAVHISIAGHGGGHY